MEVWVALLLVAVVSAKHEVYEGWKSYYVGPSTPDQVRALYRTSGGLQLEFIQRPLLDREGVVLVRPEYQDGFEVAMDELGIAYRIHRADLKKALDLDDERILRRRQESQLRSGAQFPYDNYQELEVIDAYLQQVAANHPDVVTLVTPANSYNGHPIQYLKISTTNFQNKTKPVIVIDGGIHAREWISPPVVTWAIHKLVENVTEPDLLERFDWVLLPMVNPDGYKYSHDRERVWRKTRSRDSYWLALFCPGVDGNRNFDFEWNTVGVDESACAEIYPGNRPFSEVETRVVRDILDEHLERTALYLTIHSHGSMILYPWGHNSSISSNGLALHVVGVAMAEAIDAKSLPNFPRYIVGNSAIVLNYNTSGDAENYAHSKGVPLAYTIELPGLEEGIEAFNLDPQYIGQVVQETWEGIVVGARRAGDMFKVVFPFNADD